MSTSQPATQAIKFCKDCKWFSACKHGYHQCTYPEIMDVVTGEWKPEYRFCSIMRTGFTNCGQSARYFEHKTSVRDVTPPTPPALPVPSVSITQRLKSIFS